MEIREKQISTQSSGCQGGKAPRFRHIKGSGQKDEAGRSALETLAVLVIMAFITIVAIPIYKYVTNKLRANEIVNDGRAVWVEAVARQGEVAANAWMKPSYKSATEKPFEMMRDVKGNDFVKVEEIEEEICKHMQRMQKEGQLVFFKTEPDFEAFVECEEGNNAIVMAFDGLEAPAECVSEKGCQDAHGGATNLYCDKLGHCQECDEELSTTNETGDGCECKESLGARLCQDDKERTWCCASNKICGKKMGECDSCGTWQGPAEDGKSCICDATQAVTCTGEKDGQPYTWCCGPNPDTGVGQICDYENNSCKDSDGKCQYEINVPADAEMVKSTNCSYRVVVNGTSVSVTPEQECPLENEYCYLYYQDEDCRYVVDYRANNTTIFGSCVKRTLGDAESSSVRGCSTKLQANTTIATEVVGCPANTYCYLKWHEQACTSSAEAAYRDVGTLYGACVVRTKNTVTCPYNAD